MDQLLPEECLEKVMSYLGPQDTCVLASLSMALWSASQSELLWESFLPTNYHSTIISNYHHSIAHLLSLPKRHLLRQLCQTPILIENNGSKCLMLDKQTGKIKMLVDTYGLECYHTIGTQSTSYRFPLTWSWDVDRNSWSRPRTVTLKKIHDLQILGSFHTRDFTPCTPYAVYLAFRFEVGHFGFDRQQVKVGLRFIKDGADQEESLFSCRHVNLAKIYRSGGEGLNNHKKEEEEEIKVEEDSWNWSYDNPIKMLMMIMMMMMMMMKAMIWQKKKNKIDEVVDYCWREVKLGEFWNDKEEEKKGGEEEDSEYPQKNRGNRVEFFVKETELRPPNSKSGLSVIGVEIRPLN